MPWQPARFKDKDVWIEVDAAGRPKADGGRVAMRYSKSEGARLYRAGVANVQLASGPPEDLPDGVSADAPGGAKGGAKGGKRGSGFGSAGTRTQAQAHAARESAKELVASLSAQAALCFTDGACKGNPGPAGAGCVVRLPDGTHHEQWRALGMGTNNVGELTAIGMAMDILAELGFTGEVHVLSDSDYARGVLVGGWKAKANQELIADVKAKVKRHKAKVHWIAGHVGIPENERADVLANMGVEASRSRR